jgi:hypothetical protein
MNPSSQSYTILNDEIKRKKESIGLICQTRNPSYKTRKIK